MKKLKILIVIISTATGVLFAGCYSNPDSVEIGDETYVKGFHDNLYFCGFEYHEESTALFETDNHYWWKVDGAPYDMYCAQHKEALYWNPTAYCKESEFDTVVAYYADTANYDYYIGLYLDDTAQIKLENVNTELLESAISLNIELDNTTGVGGIFDPYKDIKITFPLDEDTGIQPVLYRVSKDGLFTTSQNEWIIYEDNFYIFGLCSDEYSAYKIDEKASAYIISLFRKYGLLD